MKLKLLFITGCLTTFLLPLMAQKVNIIPVPKSMVEKPGTFTLDNTVTLQYNDPALASMATYAAAVLHVKVDKQPKAKAIKLQLSPAVTNKEGYILDVLPGQIVIKAASAKGVFYGLQSLVQLLPLNKGKQIPCVSITDEPRFAWRGLMLDVSRHFFTIAEVKKMIDEMVVYKFNLLHIHLTDDQGWRMEIKSLPELTKVGAWRVPRTGLWWEREPAKEGEPATYGGFYTQEQLKEIIAYAAAREVTVLPEIDVPGHSLAAIAAYPNLSSTKLPYKVNPGSKFYGIEDNSLCAGQEATYEFLDKVFTEVAEVFPFEYIHIGGDECYKGFWKKCTVCQQCMKEHNLKDEHELQSYFIKRLEKILQAKGKKLMGWDEILEGGLAPEASVMSWRGMEGGITAAKAKHSVVMTPTQHAYLDLYQGDPAIEPPTYAMMRLKDAYAFEPVPKDVDPVYILGGQGNLWAESVPTFRHAEYMLWPRTLALAEVLWSPAAKKNWNDFIRRTEYHMKRFDEADINYARSMYDAGITPSKDDKGKLLIQFDTELAGLDIYYTFDNTYPDHHSPKYNKGEKITIPADAETLRVVTYKNGKPIGRIITASLDALAKR